MQFILYFTMVKNIRLHGSYFRVCVSSPGLRVCTPVPYWLKCYPRLNYFVDHVLSDRVQFYTGLLTLILSHWVFGSCTTVNVPSWFDPKRGYSDLLLSHSLTFLMPPTSIFWYSTILLRFPLLIYKIISLEGIS